MVLFSTSFYHIINFFLSNIPWEIVDMLSNSAILKKTAPFWLTVVEKWKVTQIFFDNFCIRSEPRVADLINAYMYYVISGNPATYTIGWFRLHHLVWLNISFQEVAVQHWFVFLHHNVPGHVLPRLVTWQQWYLWPPVLQLVLEPRVIHTNILLPGIWAILLIVCQPCSLTKWVDKVSSDT